MLNSFNTSNACRTSGTLNMFKYYFLLFFNFILFVTFVNQFQN